MGEAAPKATCRGEDLSGSTRLLRRFFFALARPGGRRPVRGVRDSQSARPAARSAWPNRSGKLLLEGEGQRNALALAVGDQVVDPLDRQLRNRCRAPPRDRRV